MSTRTRNFVETIQHALRHGQLFPSLSLKLLPPVRGGSQAIDGTGLVVYYRFDELSGNLVNQASKVTNNSTLGSAADGTNTSVTYGQTGKIARAYQYNGTTSFTKLGTSLSQFNFMHNSSTMKWSIAFWYKFTTDNTTTAPFFCDCNPTGSNVGIYIRNEGGGTNGQLTITLQNGSSSQTIVNTATFFPNDTNWHFVVITVDYSIASSNILCYLDGSLKSTTNKSGTTSASNATDAGHLAVIGDESIQFNKVSLDEFSIWSRVLSSSEITTLYNGGNGIGLYDQLITDTLTIVESVTKVIAKNISDSLSISDNINKLINKTISDTLGLSDSIHVNRVTQTVSDNIFTTDTVSISKSIVRNVVDNLVLGDSISKSIGKRINDSSLLTDNLSKNISKILSDNINLVDTISKNIVKLIVDNPSFLDSNNQSKTFVKQITDALSIIESTVFSRQITRQIIDNLSTGDSIARGIGKLLSDNPSLSEQLSKAIAKIITDNISIPDSVTKNIGSLLLNQTRKINLNNTTQQIIAEGKPRNVTI